MEKIIAVNLFSGPSGGKSTTRAGVFYFLKCAGIPCEEASEYAKGKVLEGSASVLRNQVYVFGKQHHITTRASNGVKVVVSDSPLLLSIVYDKKTAGGKGNKFLHDLVLSEHEKFDNMNYFMQRPADRPYQQFGRTQSKEESEALDLEVVKVLEEYKIEYKTLLSVHDSTMQIVSEVIEKINQLNDKGI